MFHHLRTTAFFLGLVAWLTWPHEAGSQCGSSYQWQRVTIPGPPRSTPPLPRPNWPSCQPPQRPNGPTSIRPQPPLLGWPPLPNLSLNVNFRPIILQPPLTTLYPLPQPGPLGSPPNPLAPTKPLPPLLPPQPPLPNLTVRLNPLQPLRFAQPLAPLAPSRSLPNPILNNPWVLEPLVKNPEPLLLPNPLLRDQSLSAVPRPVAATPAAVAPAAFFEGLVERPSFGLEVMEEWARPTLPALPPTVLQQPSAASVERAAVPALLGFSPLQQLAQETVETRLPARSRMVRTAAKATLPPTVLGQ